jgi:hypothetical protein
MSTRLQCDMDRACPNEVTHFGEKGWLYCSACAPRRAGWERTRKLRAWEVPMLEQGKAIFYRPYPQAEMLTRLAGGAT